MSGAFKFAVYVGSDSALVGKTALLMTQRMASRGRCPDGKVIIQADDISTGYGRGWHAFPIEDWKVT